MFVNFNEEVRHILKQAEKERNELKHPYVGSEHLFLAILKDNDLSCLFNKYKINYSNFKKKLISLVGVGSKNNDFVLYTPLIKSILENAIIEAKEEKIKEIAPENIIILILKEKDGVAYSILKSMNVNIDKLYHDLRVIKNNKCTRKKNLMIEDIGTNLNKLATSKKLDPVIGRQEEINNTIQILSRRKKNNPILVGPAGVGKTAIVEGIANIITSKYCPNNLKGKKIISLNIFSIVAGTKYRGEFEEKMKKIIKELEDNQDIILFIDEIHTIVGAGGAEGAIDASNIFKPALARGNIKIIGATTLDEYKKYIEPDAALARRFQSVLIEEPDTNSVIKILKDIKPVYENYHNVKISNDLIYEIVSLSQKYLTNRFEPDKSIDILDEACALAASRPSMMQKRKETIINRLNYIKYNKNKSLCTGNFNKATNLKKEENKLQRELRTLKLDKNEVTKSDVTQIIKNKGNIKLLSESKGNLYLNIKNKLNKEIIGENENIDKFIKTLVRKSITNKKKTYSILITGPSGCGKSFLAEKFLDKIVNKKDIIKINLSDYKEPHTISKLIGTTAGYLGYDNKNNIFEKVRFNPSSALLVENFSEGCNSIQDLFIKILEYGYIEDGSGKKIDFSNANIIFTDKINDEVCVGFKGKSPENEVQSRLESLVFDNIILKKADEEKKKKIIFNIIKNNFNVYETLNNNIEKKYGQNIYNKVRKSDNLKIIKNNIEKEINNILVNEIVQVNNIIHI